MPTASSERRGKAKYLGGGTFYLTGIRDSSGALFNGKDTYKLNVPKYVPAKDFWSVIVYSMASKGFVRNAPRVGLSSRNTDTMQVNDDGSYDIYFAPKAPASKSQEIVSKSRSYQSVLLDKFKFLQSNGTN